MPDVPSAQRAAAALAATAKAIAGTEDLSIHGRKLTPEGTAPLSPEEHDAFFHRVASCAGRSEFPSGYIGDDGKAARLEHFLGSPAGRSFLDECAMLVRPLDANVLQPGATGQLLWGSVRSATVLVRERAPQVAARAPGDKCELGQQELQPIFDYVLARAAPLHAWSVKAQLNGMSDAYLLDNPDANNAMTAWDVGCLSLQDQGLKVWREARTAALFWEAVAALPPRLLVHLSTPEEGAAYAAAGAEPPALGSVPALQELLQRARNAEEQAWELPPGAGYLAALKTMIERELRGSCLVVWVSLEPVAGRRIDVYPRAPAQILEDAYAKMVSSQGVAGEALAEGSSDLVDVRTRFPADDTVVQMLRRADGGLAAHQHTPSTNGVRSVARVRLPGAAGLVEFAAVCTYLSETAEQWELLRPGWKERGLERVLECGRTETDEERASSGSNRHASTSSATSPVGREPQPAMPAAVRLLRGEHGPLGCFTSRPRMDSDAYPVDAPYEYRNASGGWCGIHEPEVIAELDKMRSGRETEVWYTHGGQQWKATTVLADDHQFVQRLLDGSAELRIRHHVPDDASGGRVPTLVSAAAAAAAEGVGEGCAVRLLRLEPPHESVLRVELSP